MSKFDKTRFAESLFAAIAGAAIYDKARAGNTSRSQRDMRNFQRAFMVAMSHDQFTEDVAERYVKRISTMKDYNREKYISLVLQPSPAHFSEKDTAVFIFDHALANENKWDAISAIMGLNKLSLSDEFEKSLRSSAEKVRQDRLNTYMRRDRTFFGKLLNLLSAFDHMIDSDTVWKQFQEIKSKSKRS